MCSSVRKVHLPDLESILQKSINEKLRLLDYTTENLLPFGENYTSQMLKVEATISKTKESEPEILHLVAKRGGDFEKYVLTWPETFRREVFFYNELIPTYRKLELELGIKEKDLFNDVPSFLGYYIEQHNGVEKINSNSYMLMENILVRDYYVGNRFTGVNYDHAKNALSSLARFSGLGIAAKQRKSEFFRKAKTFCHMQNVQFNQMNMVYDSIFKVLNNMPSCEKYLTIMKKSYDYCKSGGAYFIDGDEPWVTITHSDIWMNNIMFHKNYDTGKVNDVKLIDWQLYMYHSPARDLCYYLSVNLDEETEIEYFNDLIDCFYNDFVKTLEDMNLKTDDFTRDSFDIQVNKNAARFFFHFAMLAMCCVMDTVEERDDDLYTVTLFEKTNVETSVFTDRLLRLIRIYERKNWFTDEYFH